MNGRWHVTSTVGLAVAAMALTCVVAPPAAAGSSVPQIQVSAPAAVSSGVLPKYRAKYKAIMGELGRLWAGNQNWFAEQVSYGDQLATTLTAALAIPSPEAKQLVDQLEKRAAEWGMEMFATTDVEMPLDVPRIEKFRDACMKMVKTQDDRDAVKYEFGRLILAQDTQLILTVGGDMTKVYGALVEGNVAAYRAASTTAQTDWGTANQTFTRALELLTIFGSPKH
ncbi:MAG: hypothetical protein IPO93_10835 [Actinobacteria bacterium]|jgi:hypothetical protein|nr:hypothetical protein [Actinomycetota bacterium]